MYPQHTQAAVWIGVALFGLNQDPERLTVRLPSLSTRRYPQGGKDGTDSNEALMGRSSSRKIPLQNPAQLPC